MYVAQREALSHVLNGGCDSFSAEVNRVQERSAWPSELLSVLPLMFQNRMKVLQCFWDLCFKE